MRVKALKCLLCGDIIYSRARHDCRHCSCGNCFVDGGFDYLRYGAKKMKKVKDVKITVKKTKRELWDDWNLARDKYGLIEGLRIEDVEKMLDEEIKRGLKSGKPEPVYKGNKMTKSIKEGIKDLKEGKITTIKKGDSIDTMFEGIDKKRKAHPVYYFFHDIYWRVHRFIEMIPYNVRRFANRGKRGWDYSDVWGFDWYLATVIADGVKHLKKHGRGLPTWKEGKTEKVALREWREILDTIIKTFETAKKIIDGDLYYIPSKEFTWAYYKRYVRLAGSINKKKYMKIGRLPKQRVMNKREVLEFEKGFDLFKEWFFALWD